jgi:hypothetical protein
MNIDELKSVAEAIVARQKGILAADESNPTIKKRFAPINVESTEENRRRYRELLFTAEGIERYISGVILYDETIRQSSKQGIPFPQVLSERGIIPGIKVDKGAKPLALQPGKKSLKVWTACATGWRNTNSWVQNLPSGGQSWKSTSNPFLLPMPFGQTVTPWLATQPSARKPALCPLWNRKF